MKNPLSKEAFLDWVEKQPADKAYCYVDGFDCPIFQYLDFVGLPVYMVRAVGFWDDKDGNRHQPFMDYSVVGLINNGGERWTFGALAERLRNG